ncbi:MAG: adenylate kinase family protein [Candidatus Woesearchaeota archaeon]
MILAITGTPGCGKTTQAKKIATILGIPYINLTDYCVEHKLTDGFDSKRDCHVLSISKIEKHLQKHLDFPAIIDSHLSHDFSPEWIDACIVCQCELATLKKRLKKRAYSPEKIRENLDAHIFDTCHVEALENGHRVCTLDCTNPLTKDKLHQFLKENQLISH